MSASSKMKMSAFKDAIMLTLKGGHYAGKGHNNNESEGAKAAECDSQGNR